MANDLNLPQISTAQSDNQHQTSNDADAAVANAVQDIFTVDFSGGNVTLTSAQFRSAMTFIPSGLSTNRDLTVPQVKRAQFIVHNTDAADTITVKRGSTSIAVAATKIGVFYTDGTTDGLAGVILTPGVGGVGDVVGPASAVDSRIAAFDGPTGKMLKDGGATIASLATTARQVISGGGLTGGGDLSADRTLAVGAGTGIVVNADDVAVDEASAAQIWANTANKVITTDASWSAAAPVTLTDAATIAVDMGTFLNAVVTLGGNRTLGQPSNTKNGQSGCIEIIQDGSGNRTLAYHSDWKFAGGTDPTLSTAIGAIDLLFYQVIAANVIYANLVKAIA
jgi:hypothetical protein